MHRLPQTKVGQVLELMRDCIVSGEWSEGVPPERELANRFMVSRTTLRKAIESLERDGTVSAVTSTRRGRQIAARPAPGKPAKQMQVIVMTPSLRGSSILLEQLASLRERLGAAGLQVHVHEAGNLVDRKAPGRELKRIAARRPNSIWVLHRMPRAIQQAVAKDHWPAVVFGSIFPGIDLPYIDIDFRAVARHATGVCLARGCRRITLLIHRTMLAGDVEMVDAVTEILAAKGERPPEILRHDFNRARLTDRLDRQLSALKGEGSVLMISNQHHLLTAITHLLHRGVRIPEDLGLLYLSNDVVVERMSPLPYRYDSGQALIRKLTTAVKSWAWGQIPASGLVIPRLLEGETLLPPGAGR
jgi:LacI family transcriptional regulator